MTIYAVNGKTRNIIERSANTGLTIVEPSFSRVMEISRAAKELGLTIPRPISFARFLFLNTDRDDFDFKNSNQKYIIDDLEKCLSFMKVESVFCDISNVEMEDKTNA